MKKLEFDGVSVLLGAAALGLVLAIVNALTARPNTTAGWTSETICSLVVSSGGAVSCRRAPYSFVGDKCDVVIERTDGRSDWIPDMRVNERDRSQANERLYSLPEQARQERQAGFQFVVANSHESDAPTPWPDGMPWNWHVGADAGAHFLAVEESHREMAK